MSFTWRMEVKDETFTDLRDHPSVGQDYITPDAGVASLDDFSVDGAGNCLEARFRASPKFVDIRARDIVSLEISEDGGSTWTPVYRGYVVTAGNPRSDAIQEYKLVGLRQRFFEITNTLTHLDSGDSADQAEEVFQYIDDESDWPAGVTQSVPTLPDFGFVNGVRYPQKESYGDTLKAIAESVGRFVVPINQTYTYDGRTYNELETVPAARFGVDGAGNVIFARPQAADAVFNETGENVLAQYTQVTGEEIFDTVELIYATENFVDIEANRITYDDEDGKNRHFLESVEVQPLSRVFTFGSKNAVRKVPLAAPKALMSTANLSVVETSEPINTVINPAGAISGGVTSVVGTPGASVSYQNDDQVAFRDGFIVNVEARQIDNTSQFVVGMGLQPFGSTNLGVGHVVSFSNASLTDDFQRFSFVLLPVVNFPSQNGSLGDGPRNVFNTAVVAFSMVDVEMRNLEIYVPDVDAGGTKSRQFASGFVRDVQQDVAEVTLVNQFGPVAPRMVWTPEGESPVTVPVERIQYTLTTNDGLITQYELGQAFDAELLSERAVLKGLAREAVSE